MSKKIKICLYWFSVVLPVVDIVKGAISGIQQVWKEVHTEEQQKRAAQIYHEMKNKFYDDNL